MTALAFLLRTIGIGGCAFFATLIYFTGIPGASRIPFLSSLPIIGDLSTGRMHSYAADQVAIAVAAQNSRCEAEKSGLVSAIELSAVKFQLERERVLRVAADKAASEAANRAADARRVKEEREAEIERLRADAAQDETLSRPTEGDRNWLSKR